MEDCAKQVVVEVEGGELLLADICRMSEEESREESVLKACAYEVTESGGADSLLRKGCVEVEALFCEGGGVLI